MIDQTRATHASEWPASIYCPSSALMPGLPDAVMRVGGREMLQQMAALGPLRLTVWTPAGLALDLPCQVRL